MIKHLVRLGAVALALSPAVAWALPPQPITVSTTLAPQTADKAVFQWSTPVRGLANVGPKGVTATVKGDTVVVNFSPAPLLGKSFHYTAQGAGIVPSTCLKSAMWGRGEVLKAIPHGALKITGASWCKTGAM